MTKVYPPLEDFLNALGYLYCTDTDTRTMVEDLGIRFKSLPQCFATTTAYKAQSIGDFALAKHELYGDIVLLEKVTTAFRIVPDDPNTFQVKLKSLLEDHQVFELCAKGQADPQGARESIRNFQESMTSDVTFGDFANVMQVHLAGWKSKVEAGQSLIKIPRFEKLSEVIGGFNPGRLGSLYGDTGFGKTNCALQLALMARQVMGVLYINQEMGLEDISKRIATLESGIPHKDFYFHVRKPEWANGFANNGRGFFITEGRSLSLMQIKALIRRISKTTPLGFVVIDYDQCIELETSRDVPEWKALQNALSDLDNFSKEMDCFILVLGQLNREGEVSASHRATFKAHTVLHFRNDDEHGAVIHAKKNRHGRAHAAVSVNYDEETSQITELEVLNLKSVKKTKREIQLPKQKGEPWWNQG